MIDKLFSKVNIPEEIYFQGKAIDGFLHYENSIIAIDNMIMPKYLIVYSKDNLPNLMVKETIELQPNGTYEEIFKGVNNRKYSALISSTVGGYSNSNAHHLTILKTQNLNQGFNISSIQKKEYFKYLHWNDILLNDDNLLYIASKEKGLGVFRIKDNFFKKKSNDKTKRYYQKTIDNSKIKYIYRTQDEIVELIPFNQSKIILITKDLKEYYNYVFTFLV